MSKSSKIYEREKRMRSLDTIRVHNPTSEDFVFWYDKYGPSSQRLIVPKAQKDIGKGKGNNDMPRHLAETYTRSMIEQIITKIADREWEEKQKEYRTLDEKLAHADRVVTRTNNPALWEEWFPKVWLGVIEKYGGETLPEPIDPTIPDSGNPMTDVMKKVDPDRPYEQPQE